MIVYLDTNVYIGAQYKFDSGKMVTLKNHVNSGKVTVLYTSATTGEVIKHLENDVASNVSQYNRAIRKNMLALNEDNVCKIEELKVESVVTSVIDKFMNFLNLDGVEEIPLNPLDADKLFDDYFAGNAPFEKKKPYEFKDAIMINAVKNYQKSIKEQICVVSDDEGFRKAFSENSDFVTFRYLGDFFKYCNEKFEEETKITKCIERAIEYGEFDYILKEHLNNYDIWIDYYEQWECNNKEITDICSELLYIEKIKEKIYAVICSELELLIDINYRDEEMSYYDKEEEKYLFENYVHAKEKHKIKLETRVYCNIENNSDQEFVLKNFEIVEDNKSFNVIDLDDDTLFGREELGTTLDEETDLEHCSQCGKVLFYDTMYQDREGRVICSSCMKSDGNGEICPECGRKIPHEYMSSGFCQDCVNEKN